MNKYILTEASNLTGYKLSKNCTEYTFYEVSLLTGVILNKCCEYYSIKQTK